MTNQRTTTSWLLPLLAFLFFLSLIYILYSIFSTQRQRSKQQKTQQTLQQQEHTINSLNSINDSLQENQRKITVFSLLDTLETQPPIVAYEVQIGAFKHFDLAAYTRHFQNLRHDQLGGFDKYTLAGFTTYEEAKNFQKDIQRMGVEDAFIVGKIQGKRVDIEKAIAKEKAISEK